MDERWEVASSVLINVAYTVAVLVMIVMAVPTLRAGLVTVAGHQAHAWRYGRWLGSRARPPAWTALLAREDLPAERA